MRCGFAGYFHPGAYADHRICEYRASDDRWARADAQLDAPHRRELGIAFDIVDMPDGAFVTAGEAWRRMRAGAAAPDEFGHHEARGEWFMRVNLARDLQALTGREVSDWDGWRAVPPARRPLCQDARAWCDIVAEAAGDIDRDPAAVEMLARDLTPFRL